MNATGEKLYACSEYIRSRIPLRPAVALVLGSGLGDFADKIDIKYILPYSDIESFPVSTISGHAGRYVFGYLNGVPVCAMQGRVHLYEGYPVGDVVLPIRVMGLIGAHSIILTNAAGGINKTFHPGMFMLLSDHISSFVPSPLTGENIPSIGVRFPDMSAVYDPSFRSRLLQFARKENIDLREGVYLQVPGPQYETPTEIKMYSSFGADAVGMSTACEAIAAHHMGMRVGAISCITNMAAGLGKKELSHDEVKHSAALASENFAKLVAESVTVMAENFQQD